MKIAILDVGHGNCAMIMPGDGRVIMVDCGIKVTDFILAQEYSPFIDKLIISHFDEDHVSALPRLVRFPGIGSIISNPTIDHKKLKMMKAVAGMHKGVKFAHRLLKNFEAGVIGKVPILSKISMRYYCNLYCDEINEMNNLSVAVFVYFGKFSILFPGDLEEKGWLNLLGFESFRRDLNNVNVLVASHHGRENGQCKKVFDFCKPEVIIYSDDPIIHATQITNPWYYDKASGIIDRRTTQSKLYPKYRSVVTTRKDGSLLIDAKKSGSYTIYVHAEEAIDDELYSIWQTSRFKNKLILENPQIWRRLIY